VVSVVPFAHFPSVFNKYSTELALSLPPLPVSAPNVVPGVKFPKAKIHFRVLSVLVASTLVGDAKRRRTLPFVALKLKNNRSEMDVRPSRKPCPGNEFDSVRIVTLQQS